MEKTPRTVGCVLLTASAHHGSLLVSDVLRPGLAQLTWLLRRSTPLPNGPLDAKQNEKVAMQGSLLLLVKEAVPESEKK